VPAVEAPGSGHERDDPRDEHRLHADGPGDRDHAWRREDTTRSARAPPRQREPAGDEGGRGRIGRELEPASTEAEPLVSTTRRSLSQSHRRTIVQSPGKGCRTAARDSAPGRGRNGTSNGDVAAGTGELHLHVGDRLPPVESTVRWMSLRPAPGDGRVGEDRPDRMVSDTTGNTVRRRGSPAPTGSRAPPPQRTRPSPNGAGGARFVRGAPSGSSDLSSGSRRACRPGAWTRLPVRRHHRRSRAPPVAPAPC
jgi:hypothetical protein